MSRFFKMEFDYDWWFVFDSKQQYTDPKGKPIDGLVPMSESQVADVLNEWVSIKEDFEEICDESVYTCNTDKIWDWKEDYEVKRYAFYELLMNQSDRIKLLEEQLVDVECEVEMLEEENRRLKDMLSED